MRQKPFVKNLMLKEAKTFKSMTNSNISKIICFLLFFIWCNTSSGIAQAKQEYPTSLGNFGLPGLIDLPSGRKMQDGNLVITQQLHSSLARTTLSFQAFPNIGFNFAYSGHGINGLEANGRINHDRSFDVHLTLWEETKYRPAFSMGLRDFLGTGWYSSEYLVGSKKFNRLEVTAGIGFGRLAGQNTHKNPFIAISEKFRQRGINSFGEGGSIGSLNWFQGDFSTFFGLHYSFNNKLSVSLERTPDLMTREASYIDVKDDWNYSLNYRFNKHLLAAAQYLHGSELAIKAILAPNPKSPPYGAGQELAPVPMRLRNQVLNKQTTTNLKIIEKVLKADNFEIIYFDEQNEHIRIGLVNRKFRSTAQATGRITSTLQRFSKDQIKTADIFFYKDRLHVATYRINLNEVTSKQFGLTDLEAGIKAIDLIINENIPHETKFSWGLGPYFEHRLFNPDLPLSVETGLDLGFGYQLNQKIKIAGSLRKSVLTNLTDNKRLDSGSVLPRVHSDWVHYDLNGQKGHIYDLSLEYMNKLAPALYGRIRMGLLEPFFAGIGGEILFKPINSALAVGFDIHAVKQRDFDMKLSLRDYATNTGHLSLYYPINEKFDLEMNLGRYLAGDWGVTTKISRVFGNGWEVGGYATFTDVPFEKFGEGSFDKAIYVNIPIDWIIGKPNQSKRTLAIRPITRDGGAQLSSSRSIYKYIRNYQSIQFKRERGRLWK